MPTKKLGIAPQNAAATLPEPTLAEKWAIAEVRKRRDARHPRVNIKLKLENKTYKTCNPHNDGAGWGLRLENAFGTRSHAFTTTPLSQVMTVLRPKSGKVSEDDVNAVLAVLDGAKPESEIEAMLIMQMAITHALAMKTAGTLCRVETIPQQDSAGLVLSRLTRTFTTQIEALAKLRRGGAQKVTVEHVHVYPGGQAIVGNVNHNPGAGGAVENEQQPHAADDPRALAFAGEPAMWCEDPDWPAVSVAKGEGQNPVPNARGRARLGSTEGKS